MDEGLNGAWASDLDLLRACADGDEASLAELHRRHVKLCHNLAYRVLQDAARADEAVQDAFFDLWSGAADFRPERAAVRTWLCVLVHRRAVDIARREARHRLLHDVAEPLDPSPYTTEELLILRLDRRQVRAALDELSPAHRQVIDLAYWGGLSQTQIAARCGVSVGTIKSRTFAALARLALIVPRAVLDGGEGQL